VFIATSQLTRSVFEAVTLAEFAQRIRVMRWAANPTQVDPDIERKEIWNLDRRLERSLLAW
jgi:hypothetical protein